mmetsp:Transcript_118597/g.369449  ORF Transcript_118597/g.369449 Transcript_118597/m.369449 type:complete len:233 (-) Transcript_118597:895-1593(-)
MVHHVRPVLAAVLLRRLRRLPGLLEEPAEHVVALLPVVEFALLAVQHPVHLDPGPPRGEEPRVQHLEPVCEEAVVDRRDPHVGGLCEVAQLAEGPQHRSRRAPGLLAAEEEARAAGAHLRLGRVAVLGLPVRVVPDQLEDLVLTLQEEAELLEGDQVHGTPEDPVGLAGHVAPEEAHAELPEVGQQLRHPVLVPQPLDGLGGRALGPSPEAVPAPGVEHGQDAGALWRRQGG